MTEIDERPSTPARTVAAVLAWGAAIAGRPAMLGACAAAPVALAVAFRGAV
jgi:hypothetical protein